MDWDNTARGNYTQVGSLSSETKFLLAYTSTLLGDLFGPAKKADKIIALSLQPYQKKKIEKILRIVS